ncbi:30S ribosomal protein S6 [Durusdinium trenchii]|uniref:30S ribosomal protein S6 n=1 Tax=Durusdinium trenchii TaxID=1381693 RepID=A0ABP0H636_9DINO
MALQAALESEDWKSVRPGKISWSAADVKATAVDLKASLPLSVTQVITAKEWRGGPLVQLEDTISRPAASDLIVNYWFIKAFVRKCPDKVPSAFFVADVILYMDRLFCERLLIAQNPGENKKSLAGEEGKKIKAKSHGHADESSSDNGDEQAESVHGSSDGHLPPAQEQVEGDSVACPADDDVKMVEAAESDDELDATTLPGPGDVASLADDDEEMPPLAHPSPERDQANEEADEESSSSYGGYDCFFESPECGNSGPPRNELIEMCLGLMQYLSQEHPDIMKCLGGRHFHMVNYMDHCEWSFSRFSIRATSWLSTKEHFARWLKRFNELNRTSDCNKVLDGRANADLTAETHAAAGIVCRKPAEEALGFKRAREESTAGAPNGAGEGAKATEPKAKKPKNGEEQKREKTEELTIAGDKFKTYDLKALQAIEVLLKNKAFVVKRIGAPANGIVGEGKDNCQVAAVFKVETRGLVSLGREPTFVSIDGWDRVKLLALKRRANASMPFKQNGAAGKPTTWKQKHKQSVLAGLRFMKAPMVLAALCSLMFANSQLNFKPLDHLELFAGVHSITSGEWKESRHAIPMDLTYDKDGGQDILTPVGFCNMLYQVLSLRPGGALWSAPVCSSSRGSTQRRTDNPMGCTSSPSVAAGNLMVARLTILLAIAVAKRCMWPLEQPVNSLLDGHVLFQQFLRLKQVTCYRVSTSLSWFGADTRKPLWVYSSRREIQELNDFADRSLRPENQSEMIVRYEDSEGKQRIKGGSLT